MRANIPRRIHLHDVESRDNTTVHYKVAEIIQPDGQCETITKGTTILVFNRSSSGGVPHPPYIAMVNDIYTKGDPVKPYFIVRWFYRANEIPVIDGYLHEPHMVYLSDINDEIPMDAMFERIDVFFRFDNRPHQSSTVQTTHPSFDSLVQAVQKGYDVHKFDSQISYKDSLEDIVNARGGSYDTVTLSSSASSAASSSASLPWPLPNSFLAYIPYSLPLPFTVCCGIYRPWQKRIDDLDEQFRERYRSFTVPTIDALQTGQYLPAHFRYRKLKVFLNIRGGNVNIRDPNFIDNDISTVKSSLPILTHAASSSITSPTVLPQGSKGSSTIYLDSSGGIVTSSSTVSPLPSLHHTSGTSHLTSTIIIPPKAKNTETKTITIAPSNPPTNLSSLSSSSSSSVYVTLPKPVTATAEDTTGTAMKEDSDTVSNDVAPSLPVTPIDTASTTASNTVVTGKPQRPRGRGRPPISYYGAMRQAVTADTMGSSNINASGTAVSSTGSNRTNVSATNTNAPVRLPLRYDIMDTIGWNKVRPLGGDPCIRLVNNKKLQTCRPGAQYQVYLPDGPIAPVPAASPWQKEQQNRTATVPWVPPILPPEPTDSENDGEEKVPFEWPDNATTTDDETTEEDETGTSTNDENGTAKETNDATTLVTTTTTTMTLASEVTKEESNTESSVTTVPMVATAVAGTTLESSSITTVTVKENANPETNPTTTATATAPTKPGEPKKKVPKGRTLFDLSNVQDPPPVPWTLERVENEPMKLQWSSTVTLRNNTIPSTDKSQTLTLSLDNYLFLVRKETIALRTGIRVGAPHPRFLRTWPGVLICWTDETNETSLSALEASLSSTGTAASSASSLSSAMVTADTVAPPGFAYVSFIDSKFPTCVPLRSLHYGTLHRWVTDEEGLEILHQNQGDVLQSLETVRNLVRTRKQDATEFHRTHYPSSTTTDSNVTNDTATEAPKPVHSVNLQLNHHDPGQSLRHGIEALKGTVELSCLPRISSETGLISSIHSEEFGKHVGGSGRSGWSPAEQVAFASGITRFGKNFHHIAGIIPDKSVGECVAYYFRNKHFRMLLQGIGYRSLNPTPRAGLKSSDILRDSTTLYMRPRSTDTTGSPYVTVTDKDKNGNTVTAESSSVDGRFGTGSSTGVSGGGDIIHIGPPRLPLIASAGWPGPVRHPRAKHRVVSRGRGRGRPPLRTRRVNRFALQTGAEDEAEEIEGEEEDYDEENEDEGVDEEEDDEETGENEDGEEETVPEDEDETSALPPELTSLVPDTVIERNTDTPVMDTANALDDPVVGTALLDAIIDETMVTGNPLATPIVADDNEIMETIGNRTVKEALDDDIAMDDQDQGDDNDAAEDENDENADEDAMDQEETSGDDTKDNTGAEDETNDNGDTVPKSTELTVTSQQPRRSGRGTLQVGDLVILPRELTYPDTQVHAVLKIFGHGTPSTATTVTTTTLSTNDPASKLRKLYPSVSPVAAAGILTRWCSLCRRMQASVLVCTNPDCAATVCDRCFRSSIQQRRFNPYGMPAKPSWRLARNNSWWMCCDCCPPIPSTLEWDLYSRWSKSLLALHALHAPVLPDQDGENGRSTVTRTAPHPTDRTLRQRSGISFSDMHKNAYKPESGGDETGRTKRSRLARDGTDLNDDGGTKKESKRGRKGQQEILNSVDMTPVPFTYSKFDMSGGSVSKTVTLQDAFSYLERIKEFFGPAREAGVSSFMRLLSLYKKRALTVTTLMRDIIHLLTSYRAPKPLLRDFSFFVPAEHHAFYYDSCMNAFRNAPVPLIDAGVLPREGRKVYNRPVIPINGILYLRGRQGYIHQLDYLSPSLDVDVHQYKIANSLAPPSILPPNLQHLQATAIPFYPPPLPQPVPNLQVPPQMHSGHPSSNPSQLPQAHPHPGLSHGPGRPPHMVAPYPMGHPPHTGMHPSMNPMGAPPQQFVPPNAGYPHPPPPHHPYYPPNQPPPIAHHPGMTFMPPPGNAMAPRGVMNAPPPRPLNAPMGGNIVRPMNVPSIGSQPPMVWNQGVPQGNVRPPYPNAGGNPTGNPMMMVMMNNQQPQQPPSQQHPPPTMVMNTGGPAMVRPPGGFIPSQSAPMGYNPHPGGHPHPSLHPSLPPGRPPMYMTNNLPPMMMGRPAIYVNNPMGQQGQQQPQPSHPSLMGQHPPRG